MVFAMMLTFHGQPRFLAFILLFAHRRFTDHLSAKNVSKTFAKTPLFAKNRTAAIFTREFKDIIGDEFRILANSRPRLFQVRLTIGIACSSLFGDLFSFKIIPRQNYSQTEREIKGESNYLANAIRRFDYGLKTVRIWNRSEITGFLDTRIHHAITDIKVTRVLK